MASSTASGAAVTPSLTPLPPDDLLIIGVDSGTGSSRVNAKHVHGIFTRESAKIRVIRLKADQDVATKQILILHKDGNVVYGNHDVNKAMQQDRTLKAKAMRRIKLALHPEFSRLDDVVHTLATIYAKKDWAALQDLFEDFLRAVLNDVRTAFKRPDLRSGKPDSYWDAIPLEIHISVPAMWNDGQRGTVRNAAQRAAMASGRSRKDPMIDLCEEALCVAIYFLSKNLAVKVGSLHIFVDVGDGTLDITTVVVTRAHSSSTPMQIQRVGLCSGSGAGAHMINAEAEAFIIKKYGEAYVDRKCRQLDISRHEFSRQLWKEIDKLKRDMNESSIGDLHYIRISGNHGRMEPGLLNHWPIPLTDEEMAQCVDRWTTRTDQLLQEHLAALSAEHEMTNISAILTGVSFAIYFPGSQWHRANIHAYP